MDDTYQIVLQWLVGELKITETKDVERAITSIVKAQKRFPTHYSVAPSNPVDVIKTEIFKAECIATYHEGLVGTNQLALYQQNVVARLMQLRRLELGI